MKNQKKQERYAPKDGEANDCNKELKGKNMQLCHSYENKLWICFYSDCVITDILLILVSLVIKLIFFLSIYCCVYDAR